MNDLFKKVLPWLGAAASGNVPLLVGMAAKTVGEALGGEVADSAEAIAAAVSGATPDQLSALKQAEAEFQFKMQELGFKSARELAQVAADDRANARQREIATHDSWTPRLLAALIVVGYAAVQWFLLTHDLVADMREIIMRALGAMDAALTLVLGYYFGSSAGSQAKDRLLRQ